MATGTAIQFDFLLAGVNEDGDPVAGGLVYAFAVGTVSSYTNPNPALIGGTYKNFYKMRPFDDDDPATVYAQGVALNSEGRLQAYGDGLYDVIIRSPDNDRTIMYVENYECSAGADQGGLSQDITQASRMQSLIYGGV